MKLHYNSNIPELIEKARQKLESHFEQNKEKKILFLASGGSAFSLIDDFNFELLGPHITITVLDERADHDPKINNFAQLQKTKFFQEAKQRGCRFISTLLKENETSEELAERFESELVNWYGENPAGVGVSIATFGAGADGHTSGIMPFPENSEKFNGLFLGEKWVISYDATGKNPYPYRVTTTITFIADMDHGVAFITGNEKQVSLMRILSETGTLAETPARIWRVVEDVEVFTDVGIS